MQKKTCLKNTKSVQIAHRRNSLSVHVLWEEIHPKRAFNQSHQVRENEKPQFFSFIFMFLVCFISVLLKSILYFFSLLCKYWYLVRKILDCIVKKSTNWKDIRVQICGSIVSNQKALKLVYERGMRSVRFANLNFVFFLLLPVPTLQIAYRRVSVPVWVL